VFEAVLLGLATALLPGLHPILLRFSSDAAAAIVHGIYTSLSVLPSVYLGAFSATTAYTYIIAHRLAQRGRGLHAVLLHSIGAVMGVILALLYLPVAYILSVRLPHYLIFVILLLVAVITIIRSVRPLYALLLGGFYASLGYVILHAYPLSNPLPPAISGLFGASTIFVSLLSRSSVPLGSTDRVPAMMILRGSVFGLLAAFIVAYFPAVSLSLAGFAIHPLLRIRDDEMMVATGASASAALLLTGFGRNFGLIRSSFAAALSPEPALSTILLAGAAVFMGAALALSLAPFLHRAYTHPVSKVFALLFILLLAAYFYGLLALPLVVITTLAGTLTHVVGVEKRVAMFFLLFPTMLYYVPM